MNPCALGPFEPCDFPSAWVPCAEEICEGAATSGAVPLPSALLPLSCQDSAPTSLCSTVNRTNQAELWFDVLDALIHHHHHHHIHHHPHRHRRHYQQYQDPIYEPFNPDP